MKKSFFGLVAFAMFSPFLVYGQTTKTEAVLKEFEIAMRAYRYNKWEEAYPIFKKLADMGEPKSQFWLGLEYVRGEYLPQDDKQGYQLFLKSAQTGYPDSQYSYGLILLDGKDNVVQKDVKQGIAYIEKAALSGLEDAQYVLCLDRDSYLSDVAKAYFWCLVQKSYISPEGPNSNMVEHIKFLETKLTRVQIQEIQARAAAFKPVEWQYPADLFDK